MYYGSTQSCSKAEAKRWIKACPVIFGDAKTAAEYLCEHVKEMNK
jgi:precorrin isomerase